MFLYVRDNDAHTKSIGQGYNVQAVLNSAAAPDCCASQVRWGSVRSKVRIMVKLEAGVIGYFEGWYFKQQSTSQMIALIPAIHTDDNGAVSGSIQIVTQDNAWCVDLKKPPLYTRKPLSVEADDCVFSLDGLKLQIQRPDVNVIGQLTFGPITKPTSDIMGPYRFLPLMECRHAVFSLFHTVEGSVVINGQAFDFSNGIGYIEGDRGRSFPKKYVWTQCSWYDAGPCACMLSVAEVKPFGIPFMGVVGFVYYRGIEYRVATYCGAKVTALGAGAVAIHQGDLTLSAQMLDDPVKIKKHAQDLRAPVSGHMTRLIREKLSARACFRFCVGDRELFVHETAEASFEYEL